MKFLFLLASLLAPILGDATRALFNSLDPASITQSLAFYELYPERVEGERALARAALLLQLPSPSEAHALVPLINRLKGRVEALTLDDIQLIEALAAHLPNRRLKGYSARSEEEVIALPSDEIDLGKALILSQLSGQEDCSFQARSYSAGLDLMALQILAQLPEQASPLQKIHETNRFIFEHMHFRFPPHSIYAENIDLYTFLPSVMDNHLGVCLGVTALYLALSQRLDLPLEIITPPGHIYIRYRTDISTTLNIETTARGVHMPDETYLSISNPTLEERTMKEVIGMTHVNEASTYLHKGAFEKAVKSYEKAAPYLPEDPLVQELLGYSYLLTGQEERGLELLKGIEKGIHSISEDYLAGKVDQEGIRAVFQLVDETRESILSKLSRLQKVVSKFPEFRDGLHQLAICWIQLNRTKEAMEALTRYHQLDPTDPVTEYYLAILYGKRYDFKACWTYLKNAETIALEQGYLPKSLKDLRRTLRSHCPDPDLH